MILRVKIWSDYFENNTGAVSKIVRPYKRTFNRIPTCKIFLKKSVSLQFYKLAPDNALAVSCITVVAKTFQWQMDLGNRGFQSIAPHRDIDDPNGIEDLWKYRRIGNRNSYVCKNRSYWYNNCKSLGLLLFLYLRYHFCKLINLLI